METVIWLRSFVSIEFTLCHFKAIPTAVKVEYLADLRSPNIIDIQLQQVGQ